MRSAAIVFIAHTVVDMLITRQIAQIRQERVTAVQHTQFHLFKRDHVAHQLCPRFFPCRTPCYKVIFDNPLAERLTGHACRIANAGQLFNFIQRFWGYGGHNAVNHGRRERDVGLDPVCQRGIHGTGVSTHHVTHHMAVFRHIIAGHHAECREPRRLTTRQCFYHDTRCRFRLVRVLQISGNKWMIEHQLASGRRVAIAFFGNG